MLMADIVKVIRYDLFRFFVTVRIIAKDKIVRNCHSRSLFTLNVLKRPITTNLSDKQGLQGLITSSGVQLRDNHCPVRKSYSKHAV